MAGVDRKTPLMKIDGTPEKRLFLSIISDYNLKTGLFELVDNALDMWITSGRPAGLVVRIGLNVDRQLISVRDNAGGVPEGLVRLLIAPGATRSQSSREVIGIFGVGGKRAGVALGEHVEVSTRYRREKSLQIDITNDWIQTDDWDLEVYEIPDITPGTTNVGISKVRQSFTEGDVEDIRKALGETYAWFLREGAAIELNGTEIAPVSFEAWAFPPDFLPRATTFEIEPADNGEKLSVTLKAGLIRDRDEVAENYGVYFFCNHRLIVKELRTRDVGYFVSGEAGVPHPDASLCRVIVDLQGPAELMPWNSNKSGINFSDAVFTHIRGRLIEFAGYFSTVSRRLKGDWPTSVYQYDSGQIEEMDAAEVLSSKKKVLPRPPRARRPSRMQMLLETNERIIRDQPWTLGLIEAMGAVDLLTKQRIETKNRMALILLDSNIEIAMKEFIVNNKTLFPVMKYTDTAIMNLFKSRTNVITEVTAHVKIPTTTLAKINHYYGLRNKLIHERATVGITDAQIADYRVTVEKVLRALFRLKFPT